MSIDLISIPQGGIQNPSQTQEKQEYPLIQPDDIKAILYMGIRGKISLPLEKHDVDLMA